MDDVRMHRRTPLALGFLIALVGPPLLTAVLAPMLGREQATNAAFGYLLVVLAAAARGGALPGAVASVNSFLMFNLFLIEPLRSLTVSALHDLGVLMGFLVTSLVVSALVARVERRREEAEQQARDARLLYDLSVSIAEPAEQDGELSSLATLVEERLGLDTVALAVRHQEAVRVLHPGGRPETEIAAMLARPTPACTVASAELASGEQLVLVACAADGVPLNEHLRSLLDAIAALTAAAADRVEQQRQRRHVRILQATDRQRSALLAAVSHDLRSPLAAMTTAAGALDDGRLSASARSGLVHSIVVEGERLDRMVRNLLDLSRIEGGALAAHREAVPVDELIGGVLTRARPRLASRTLELRVPEELPLVLIDPVQIDQALANLVENVIVHTDPAAGLEITAGACEHWVTIRVADRGPGIPPADREAIFGRFVRGGAAQSGSGLGLAIARAYAVANGGRLECADTDHGSAFELHLESIDAA
jgi:two-component system, OmpR family, sensor histidine kinase KdpD